MQRRNFLKVPLAAMAAPGAILAANAVPAEAATPALKGIGYADAELIDRQRIYSLKTAWHYNWEPTTAYPALPFIPMVKNAKRLLEQDAIGRLTRQLPTTNA